MTPRQSPKWALTTAQAAALLDALPPMARTMAGLAILSELRRGELLALRWHDIDEHLRVLTVREAVYDGTFDTPKTEAGARQIPLSDQALRLAGEWKHRVKRTEPDALVFSTRGGTQLSPNNVLRRAIFPACKALGWPRATWRRIVHNCSLTSRGGFGRLVVRLRGVAASA